MKLKPHESAIVEAEKGIAHANVINVFVGVAAESTAQEAEIILSMMEREYIDDYDPEISNEGLSHQQRGDRLIQIARGLVGEV